MGSFSLPAMALSWWLFAISIHLGGVLTSYRKYSRDNKKNHTTTIFPTSSPISTRNPNNVDRDAQSLTEFPRVTILRPLKGLDCNIESNLLSSFQQDYPISHYEIIFCVADDRDPVIPLVNSLFSRHPKHTARLIIGDVSIGVNPKINNLIRGYESAKYDIVWIIDSNIWVSSSTLRRSVITLQKPGIGLVHHLPVGVQSGSFGSQLEMLFLNSVHARAYLAINQIGPSSCVIGKSTLFRRSDLEICGGLRTFGKYIAEDNMIGQAIWDLGLRHEITSDRAWQPLGRMNTWDFFSRRQRWGRIRKFTVRFAAMIEPLSECVILGGIFAYAVRQIMHQWHWIPSSIPRFTSLYVGHMVVWMALDYIVGKNVAHDGALPLHQFVRAWLVREMTCLPTYVWAMSGSTVSWRNYEYQLQPGGTVQQLKSPSSQVPNQAPKGPVTSSREVSPSRATRHIPTSTLAVPIAWPSVTTNHWFGQMVQARELYQWAKQYVPQVGPDDPPSKLSRKRASNLMLLSSASPMTSKVEAPVLGAFASNAGVGP